MASIPDPRYVTLDASGNGTVTFRGLRPNMLMQITKITIEASATGAGTVAIYYRGQLMTSKAIALMMTALGVLSLGASEETVVSFANGPANSQVKVTSHYQETPAGQGAPAPEAGFAFTESVGFTEPVDNPVTLVSVDDLLLQNFFGYNSGVLDVRAYQSFAMRMSFAGGTWLNSDLLGVTLRWYHNPAGLNSQVIYEDEFVLFNNSAVPLTDQMHGPYMRVLVDDFLSVNRSTLMDFTLLGSYRPMSGAYLRSAEDGVLLSTVAVALGAGLSTAGTPASLGFGPAMVSMISDQATASVSIRIGGTGINSQTYTLDAPVANTRVEKFIILPKQACWVVITNNAAAAATIRVKIVQQHSPL